MKCRSVFLWIVVLIFLLSPLSVYAEVGLLSDIDVTVNAEDEPLSDIDINIYAENEPLSDIDNTEGEPLSDIDNNVYTEGEPLSEIDNTEGKPLSDIDNAEDEPLSDLEKTQIAGDLITSVMDLVMDHFVGEELTPEFLYESALRGMMISLDPYSQYLSSEELDRLQKNFSGKMHAIGITLDATDKKVTVINSVLEGSPADTSGLLKGDIVLEINGIETAGESLEKILSIIEESDIVELKIKRGTEIFEKTIEKNEIRIPTVAVSEFEDLIESAEDNDNSELKYIIISEFGNETDNEFGEALDLLLDQGVKRIVLDLRGNPGGYADSVIKVCNRIVPKGPIIYTIDKDGHKREVKSHLKEKPFEKMVVLTDFTTASASEVLASALQDSKAAIVVGETTFGKGVIQSLYPMPIGGALKFTTEEYLRRNGKKLDRIGVKPDVEIIMPDLIIDPVILDDDNRSGVLPQVRSILSFLGYKLASSDDETKFDNNVKKVVKRFQKDTGIEANGELNTNTLIQLNLSLYLVYNETDKPLETAYQILRQ